MEWNFEDVSKFLKENDLGKYCEKFISEFIDGEVLLDLEFDDLENFGMEKSDCDKLIKLLQKFKKMED